MSVIEHREWSIWTNMDFFEGEDDIRGVLQFKITPALMAQQTIGFLYEKLDAIRQGQSQYDNEELKSFFDIAMIGATDELVIQKSLSIERSTEQLDIILEEALDQLSAIALCLDFPLNCSEVRFVVPPMTPESGEVFIASRKPIGRGLAFEVEEIGAASGRLTNDFGTFRNLSQQQKAAQKHYLNGLTLLGLEDQFAGLLDAAFMQFYQGCEILCGENHILKKVKAYLASSYPTESQTLQVIAHHVWQIRHNYFGHGNVGNHIVNMDDMGETFNVAKQVLVVRWLCKHLLDLSTNSVPLTREMRLYHSRNSVCFSGSEAEISQTFYNGYDFKVIPILDSSEAEIAQVDLTQ